MNSCSKKNSSDTSMLKFNILVTLILLFSVDSYSQDYQQCSRVIRNLDFIHPVTQESGNLLISVTEDIEYKYKFCAKIQLGEMVYEINRSLLNSNWKDIINLQNAKVEFSDNNITAVHIVAPAGDISNGCMDNNSCRYYYLGVSKGRQPYASGTKVSRYPDDYPPPSIIKEINGVRLD